ncbi:type IV secretion system lipoprotein VirB7 (plasmid) [Rhizobium sp. B230/85]|uniref:type IV secretion system lipoprotein VirB7 n=1 Tax=unclassified Rhizobium TaxID=2613769 RepID=UPI001AD97678|nr:MULTISPECIES: type IV secretion system lipoprotein VirB7 [unclassified Rhizobium]MBO9136610.1 type IV secretion system lipoprotein VirB7 [Rhizobium sp. B209b/85]QXZ99741.1 type IV secretion system lipoprotein VirB7 [Rhizobium sp. B230/85]
MKYFLVILSLCLASCQTNDKLASCSGPIFPLNTGRWQPSPADLKPNDAGITP